MGRPPTSPTISPTVKAADKAIRSGEMAVVGLVATSRAALSPSSVVIVLSSAILLIPLLVAVPVPSV